MSKPNKSLQPIEIQLLEVEKHARMIYDHGGNDDRSPLFRVTVTFAEKVGKT